MINRRQLGLAVAIIVFEGGLALDFRELRAAGEGVLRLTIFALPLSWGLGTLAAHALAGMAGGPATLFGAITIVTGPTVVLPLLRHVRLKSRPASFLKWEAIVNDPIGAILAAVVLETLVSGMNGHLVSKLILELVVASALGPGAGFLVRLMLSRDLAPELLKTPILLARALGVDNSNARSSMVRRSSSTFQAHNATPAAFIARRSCLAPHGGVNAPFRVTILNSRRYCPSVPPD